MTDKIAQLETRLGELTGSDDDRERVNVLIDLSAEYSTTHPRRALEAAVKARELATSLDYELGLGRALGWEGFANYLLSDHDMALEASLKAVDLLKELGDRASHARVMGTVAAVQLSLGNYDRAFDVAFEALREHRELGDRYSEGWMLHGLGQGYADFGDYKKAIETTRNALDIFRDIGYPIGIARSLNGLGSVYYEMGDLDNALKHHEESLPIFRSEKDTLGEARALNDIGLIHHARKEFDKARERHEKALALREDFGNRQAMSTSLIALGRLYVDTNELDKAFDVLHRALTIAMEIRAKPRIHQANLALSEAYAKSGEFEHALQHYKIYQQVKEEVQGDQASTRLTHLQIAYETEQSRKEAEISRLKNVELREKNEQLERLLQELRATQTQLVQTEKMAALGSLIAGIVHEINNPIGVISSATDVSRRCLLQIHDVLEESDSLEAVKENKKFRRAIDTLESDLRLTTDASARIARIVRSLRTFIGLDQAESQDVDVNAGLEDTLTVMNHKFGERIEIVRDFGDIPPVSGFPGELNQVFMNILNNATQAIDGQGTITVRTYVDDGRVCIDIADTGVGIAESEIPQLFEPTIRRRGARAKAGLGLFTSFNIMNKHNGHIQVRSTPGRGTTFTVVLPGGHAKAASDS